MELIYLACPYTHADIKVMKDRYEKATQVAAELMVKGHNVFSPITHSHPIAAFQPAKYRCDRDFWLSRDIPILKMCDRMSILMLPGWAESKGILVEKYVAIEAGIPVGYIEG